MIADIVKKSVCVLLFAACIGSAGMTAAQSRYGGYGFQAQEERRPNGERRGYPRDAQRLQQRHSDHLSPEERRKLRQQIDEAGRSIYAPKWR